MANCPHCNSDSISAIAKLWSGRGSPTICKVCGGHSYLPTVSLDTVVFGQVFLAAAAACAFLLWHWWPLALAFLAVVSWLRWQVRRVALVAVSPVQAARSRRDGNIFLALVILAVVICAIFGRGYAV